VAMEEMEEWDEMDEEDEGWEKARRVGDISLMLREVDIEDAAAKGCITEEGLKTESNAKEVVKERAGKKRVRRSTIFPFMLQCLACKQEMPPGPGFEEHRHTPHARGCSQCDLLFIKEHDLVGHIVKEHSKNEKRTKKLLMRGQSEDIKDIKEHIQGDGSQERESTNLNIKNNKENSEEMSHAKHEEEFSNKNMYEEKSGEETKEGRGEETTKEESGDAGVIKSNREREHVMGEQEGGKNFTFNMNTALATSKRRHGAMKFLHLSSEVQRDIIKRRGEEVVVLKQNIAIDCPVTCIECGKRFPNKRVRKQHKNTVHSKQKRVVKMIKCQEPGCKNEFDRREKVEDHRRRIHGEPWLVCRVEGCGRKFDIAGGLKYHMKKKHEV